MNKFALKTTLHFLCLAAGVASLSAQTKSPYPPAPGHEKLPVVFWTHYMPQVATTELDRNGHAQGGTDCFPFITFAADSEEQQITYALNSGLNGFQSLQGCPSTLYDAARSVFKKTGETFYINPHWAGQGDDPEAAAKQMIDFVLKQKDNPHLYRIDGKPVHFFYNHGKWAGAKRGDLSGPGENDSANVGKVKERMKRAGAESLLLPSFFFFDKTLLDRNDLLYRPWPAFQPIQPGKEDWLVNTKWDGMGNWSPCDVRPDVAKAMTERLKTASDRFLFIPSVWPGYDSSNRAWQAIHTTSFGMKVLHDNLRMWVTMGYRQINFVTWNDVNETMLLPSTRSPFGFSEIIQYYHQLAVDGTSPFQEPKVIAAYDSETLYGDEIYFQFLVMPEKNAPSSDYLCRVQFEDQDGNEVFNLTTRSLVPDQRTDALSEARLDTTRFAQNVEVLSPVVEVVRIDSDSNERKTILKNLRLAPIVIRPGRIQFPTPYVIALDRVDPELSLSLASKGTQSHVIMAPTGAIVPLEVKYQGKEKLRRITLAESRLTRGAFRAGDTAKAVGEGNIAVFLRIRCDSDLTYTLNLSSGKIIEMFASYHDFARNVIKIDTASFETKAFPNGKPKNKKAQMYQSIGKPVFKLVAPPNATITLVPRGSDQPVVKTTLAHLAKGPLTVQTRIDGVAATIRMELALDAVEQNSDYPLPPDGDGVRFVNIDKLYDATRYFHAWALTESDNIAYSRPLIVIRTPEDTKNAVIQKPDTPVPTQFIRSQGIFDDFVDNTSSASRNPFTPADVWQAAFPAREIPYSLLDMEEGAGSQINDAGTANQVGRCWLTGDFEWIQDGWRGSAIRLKGGQIEMKSKSFPYGAYTFSARICAKAPKASTPIAADGDHWQALTTEALRIDLLSDARVKARREIRDCAGEAVSRDALKEGWNHLVVTHDLQTLKIYLNGKLSAEAPVSKPGYKRTHSTPFVRFSRAETAGQGEEAVTFTGDIDQVEIIGTALDEAAISKLNKQGQWLAR